MKNEFGQGQRTMTSLCVEVSTVGIVQKSRRPQPPTFIRPVKRNFFSNHMVIAIASFTSPHRRAMPSVASAQSVDITVSLWHDHH